MNVAPMSRLQRATYQVWLGVGLLALGYGFFVVVARPLAVIVAPLLVALLLVYLLNPAVTALANRRVPRVLGTAVVYLLAVAAVVGVSLVVGPRLSAQVQSFAADAPDLGADLIEGANAMLARFGLTLELRPLDTTALAEGIQDFLSEEENRGAIAGVLGGLTGFAAGVFHFGIAILVGPVIAFYLLADLPRIGRFAHDAIPPTYRAEFITVGRQLTRVVGGFIRGQLLIAVIVGTAISIGLWAIGLDYWLVVGIIAGVTNVVPLLGPIFGGFVGILVALLTDGFGLAVAVLIVVTVVQQIDSQILSPVVMGRTVRVPAILVLLALLVGGTIYGIFGMLVAVPLVAGAKVLALHMWSTRVPWAVRTQDVSKEPDEGFAAGVQDPPTAADPPDLPAREEVDKARMRHDRAEAADDADPGDEAEPADVSAR